MLEAVGNALRMAGIMAWDILWALILGFLISGIIQAVVSRRRDYADKRLPILL